MESESIRINLDTQTFEKIFEEKTQTSSTYESAYQEAEIEHEKLCGHNRYSSYDSFRKTRSRRMKKKK